MTSRDDESDQHSLEFSELLELMGELAASAVDVTCVNGRFQPVDPPEQLTALGLSGSQWAESGTGRPIDNVHAEDQAKLIGLIGVARRAGVAFDRIRFLDLGEVMGVHVFDLSDHWGVVAFVRGSDSAGTAIATSGTESTKPRRMVQHRDASASFTWIDENTTTILGWTFDELVGTRVADLVHPDDVDRAADGWMMMLGDVDVEPIRLRYRDARDVYRWFEVRNTNHLLDPERGYVESEMFDVDAEMKALAKARDSESQFASLTESLPVGVLQFDERGAVVFANEWMHSLTGRSGRSITPLSWLGADDRRSVEARVQETIDRSIGADLDIRVLGAAGGTHVCRLRLRPLSSTSGRQGAIASLEDITASLDLQEQLRSMALTDPLTQLPNRRALHDWLARSPEDEICTLLFVDLDQFKIINDALGHDTGDEFLIKVSEQIRLAVRPDDFVARLGGDEFVVGCAGVHDQEEAATIASRILRALEQPMRVDGQFIPAGCSIGIVVGDVGLPRANLVSDADLAMYTAKRAGGRRYVFYDETQRRGVEDRLRQENDLRTALDEAQFELYLQPMVDLATGETVAHETLVRWNHPKAGMLPPAEFIPTTERTGLILPLGTWILDEACRHSAALRAVDAPSRVSVNVSPYQLAAANFADTVLAAVAKHRIAPDDLVLEVTETVFLDTNDDMLVTIRSLASAGVRIALDDFGTGYSSLNHLRLLPSQIVKIDRSYTADLGTDSGTTAILEAMVELAPRLGQTLVVEGIETAEQAEILRNMGVPIGQGFLFGRPAPATDVIKGRQPVASPSNST